MGRYEYDTGACRRCGTPLPSTGEVCPNCGKDRHYFVETEMRFRDYFKNGWKPRYFVPAIALCLLPVGLIYLVVKLFEIQALVGLAGIVGSVFVLKFVGKFIWSKLRVLYPFQLVFGVLAFWGVAFLVLFILFKLSPQGFQDFVNGFFKKG